ncbi:L-type lectin-domain containing receptor kinase VII.1 [Hibiscus syriacus]|uniref:L-type lectin-domain containing receptor kinase VII.1 n=1 Tax=Hibiscus syriacus TaxID=106335 RepID=A0A6A3CJB0_HIBSY|nr:L-type lectin-domain containing receptor kinase VII.1 [Hibiscus syriacus]
MTRKMAGTTLVVAEKGAAAEFDDIDNNHVGIDVNSLKSTSFHTAGYWPDKVNSDFGGLKLNNGKNYQVWIDYADSVVNVIMAVVGVKRPKRPSLNVSLDLSDVFEDEMYVGFTASTGRLVESHRILSWSFSNSNFGLNERLVTTGLPSFTIPKNPIHKRRPFIAGVTVASLIVVVSVALFSLFMIRQPRGGMGIQGPDRDIKASNVLLDKDMNGRLGDFRLARMHGHGQVATMTRVVGAVGYLAPEVVRSGRGSTQTNVFGFGVLILEVTCGRRPIEDGKPPLVDWVRQLMMQEELLASVDARLKANGEFDEEESKLRAGVASDIQRYPTFTFTFTFTLSSLSLSWNSAIVEGR